MELKSVVALVTGGASGLGEATAEALVASCGRVGICDMDEARGEAVAARLGSNAIFVKTDVTDEKSVAAALDRIVSAFGTVNVAVNCAGVATPGKLVGKRGPIPMEAYERVIRINLFGTVIVCRLCAERMMANAPGEDDERGVIINTASVAAFEGQVGQAAYAASKAAVAGMTLPLARELADSGIRVMTIAPGIFWTPMMAGLPEKAQAALSQMMPFPKRMGRAPEYAALAAHIIQNRMLNGETIRLDAAIRMAAK